MNHHDYRVIREACKISQRQLAEQSGVSQTTLSRIETGERTPTLDEEVHLRAGLRTLAPEAAERVLGPQGDARPGVRRAFVCQTCRKRTYLRAAPAAYVPDCPDHGPMVRQANMPYNGQSTEPPDEAGWPPAVDGVERRDAAMERARV